MAAIHDFIKLVPLFAGYTDEEIELVSNIGVNHKYKEKEAIIREGEDGDSFYLLLEGYVEISKSLTLGNIDIGTKEKTLIRIGAEHHGFFGEMGIVGAKKRGATVIAATNVVVFEIDRESFTMLSESDHDLGFKFMRNLASVLAARLNKANTDISKLSVALSLALSSR
jgi:CRP-like cAMP-binding protein